MEGLTLNHSRNPSVAPTPRGPFPTYFHQSCPTCGRRLQILIKYLGHRVHCTHCRAAFTTYDASQDGREGKPRRGYSVLERAERLLALLDSPRRTWTV